MAQENSTYTQEQRDKIDLIIDTIKEQGLNAITIHNDGKGNRVLLSTRERSNEELINSLEGKTTEFGDRLIIGTPMKDNPDEYNIVGNIGIRSSKDAPDGVWAIAAGHRDLSYINELTNIEKVMKAPMPSRDIGGPGM